MASHRLYRPALGVDAALRETYGPREDHYDQAVVDACIALFAEERFAFGG
jgi:response regulator RpfG family c-di-GMP phosphodiesterase